MSRFPIPDAALAHHAAVLGKTGSGKTTTAKGIVEHLVSQGARVCILDPIKSDWWGLTSSADGKRAGLPFHILGGPRGHVPLHASSGKAIAEIVANGTLPLSIIDMADFAPGGQSRFFIDFAPALLRKMRGVVHLVMEEAHLFAPKERSGVGDENMAIHWAKMLATAGRSKGIRLILVTQRTQALHNAMLGSCETMVAHRLTAPADQKPLIDWLKANTDKDVVERVSGSLASLKTGTGWVCSGEAKYFELVHFPRITTYDNSATPTGDTGTADVRTAPVDVEKLRAIVGDAAKEAEANDPKALKAEIERLKAEIRRGSVEKPSSAPQTGLSTDAALKDRERAFAGGQREGYQAGFTAGWTDGDRDGFARGAGVALDQGFGAVRDALKAFVGVEFVPGKPPRRAPNVPPAPGQSAVTRAPATVARAVTQSAPRTSGDVENLAPAQRRVLNAVGFWKAIRHDAPTREQIAAVAGYSPSSGGFNNLIGGLKTGGYLEIPQPGRVSLSATAPYEDMTPDEARAKMRSVLRNAQLKLLDAALARDGEISRDDLGAETEYSPSSGGFNNLIGSLSTLGIFVKPTPGYVAVSDWAREVLS